MLLVHKQDFVLQSDRRLVKATDVATVRTAAEIIAAAEADAARIREEAKAAFEDEKKRGYEKGIADGKMEVAMLKIEQVDSSVAFMESVEQKMADVVMKALRSFVAEVGEGAGRADRPQDDERSHPHAAAGRFESVARVGRDSSSAHRGASRRISDDRVVRRRGGSAA